MTAGGASFTAGIPPVNFDEGAPVPDGFVLQQADKLSPANIMNRLRQCRMSGHRLHTQTLDANRLVLTYQARREFVQEVLATISNACMDTRDCAARLFAIPGTALLFSVAALRFSQALFILGKEAGIANLFARIRHNNIMQTKINAYLPCSGWERWNIFFNQETDEVAPSSIPAHSDGSGPCIFRQRARPANRKRSIHLGQNERVGRSIVAESGRSIFRRLGTMLLVKSWIPRSACEEVLEGALQVTQGLLSWYARHFVEPSRFWLLFQRCQCCRGGVIVNAFLSLIVGCGSPAQCPVIDEPRTAERPRKLMRLRGCRVATIAICSFPIHRVIGCSSSLWAS